jgi:arsenate reductase (thioredoxin)
MITARGPCVVLFLCTGNSARSILAEALLNSLGKGRFRAYSAGSHPAGKVNPLALEQLAGAGIAIEGFRRKGWDEFAQPRAPAIDFVITVCDNAANEICPVWPGRPISAHWGVPDPAATEGTDAQKRDAFARTLRTLRHRIEILTRLPLDELDRQGIQKKLQEAGKSNP